jgi:hypothetical protein
MSKPSGPGPLSRIPPKPPTAAATAASIVPQADLVDAVRNWVHFDNLAESLQKQVSNVRGLRNTFEEKILTYLDTTAMRGAVLEITGAKLQKATRPKTTDLSWTYLESNLHEFYKSRGKPDDTAAILEFLQAKRDTKLVPYLKKTAL